MRRRLRRQPTMQFYETYFSPYAARLGELPIIARTIPLSPPTHRRLSLRERIGFRGAKADYLASSPILPSFSRPFPVEPPACAFFSGAGGNSGWLVPIK